MPFLQRLFARSSKRRGEASHAKLQSDDLLRVEVRSPLPEHHAEVLRTTDSRLSRRQFAESPLALEKPTDKAPDDPEWLFARASSLFRSGRFREARKAAERAAASGCQRRNLFVQLGWCCYHGGILDEAHRWMHKAVASDPESWEPHYGLGAVLQGQRRLDEAVDAFDGALLIDPNHIDALIASGVCQLDMGEFLAAEARFRRALALDGNDAGAWTNLGIALCARTDDPDNEAALQAFEHARRLESESGETVNNIVNLGSHLRNIGRNQAAIDLYDRSLATAPSAGAHTNYAHSLLASGRLLEGWTHYEFRWLQEPLLSLRPNFRQPAWNGQDLHDKTILLRTEQGFGDAIQFIRYAPRLKALGATVLLRVAQGFADFARGFPGVDTVLDPSDPTPQFDFYLHLLSLPRVFGTDLKSVPANIPYICADPARVERWGRRVGADSATLKVGIVWAGSPAHSADRYRSMSLQALAPLGLVDGVSYYSLQKGPREDEARNPPDALPLVNLGSELADFSDTAAAISHLDLVICVDTAVAHLAGAMGKPVWMMVPQPADWRWLEDREDSPWYPSMRLFRQSKRGYWDDVVQHVRTALQQLVRERMCAAKPTVNGVPEPTNSSRLAARRGLGELLGHRPGFTAVAETRNGILQYFPDEPLVGDSIRWYGEYLQAQLDLLSQMILRSATVMEVGPGVGAHAVFLGTGLSAEGHLFLCEPRAAMQRVLLQNLNANRMTNVTVISGALGTEKEVKGATDGIGPGRSRRTRPLADRAVMETLDEMQLESLDCLKISEDVPGLGVLAGSVETLWRLRPRLFIGVKEHATLTTLTDRLKELSYRCWQQTAPLFNPDNFNRRAGDIFAGRAALALLAIPEEVEIDIALDQCIEL